MLFRLRIIPILLVGLGVALMVGAGVAPRFLLGDGRLPLDLEETTWTMEDPQGRYGEETVPVTRQLHLELQGPADEESVGVRVGDTLRAGDEESDFENLVTAETWSYTMNRLSGEPEGPMSLRSIMGLPSTEVEGAGHWLKFPADVGQHSYDVFDPALRDVAPAEYVGEEEIAGRTVYVFEQTVAPTNLAEAYADLRNTKVIAEEGEDPVRAFLHHSASRRISVDQISGFVVGMDEKVDNYYADAEGQRLEDGVSYDARMAPERVDAMAGQLNAVFSQEQSRAVTIGVIVLGAILAVGGLVWLILAFRSARRAEREDGEVAE
ncbi:DUF3068 domain-containing protein [Corynebacterium timonense]|uniref:DUF3068 domain-containing protein n=1 Tax=Corynebacterium timonense TaxID=441500 RepID=A0A1H1SWS2_9CORY|nr:DUF3068 domain-containing protein [Corynebacterium timonense]SDS52432.1 Protein of unknown function [Corynebacterium timonense]